MERNNHEGEMEIVYDSRKQWVYDKNMFYQIWECKNLFTEVTIFDHKDDTLSMPNSDLNP